MGDKASKKAVAESEASLAISKLQEKNRMTDSPWFKTGEPVKNKKDVADEEFVKNKILNDNEQEIEAQQKRLKNIRSGEKPYAKGGKVSSASKRADGCCVRGKTRA
jgi:hypothetical protein